MKTAREAAHTPLGAPSGPQLISSRDTRYIKEIQRKLSQEGRSKSKGKGRVTNTSHVNQRSLSNHSNNSNGIKQQSKGSQKTVPHVYLNANELNMQDRTRRNSRNGLALDKPLNTTPDPRLEEALNQKSFRSQHAKK